MQTIDEISIGREGDMFTLTIYHYPADAPGTASSERQTFLIGLPDQFHAETQRTIGAWLPPGVQTVGRWLSTAPSPTHDAQDNPDLARDLKRGK